MREGAPPAIDVANLAEWIFLHDPKARDYRQGQVVYFIGGDDGPVKIGTTVDPENRLKHIQCGSPVPLRILAAVPGGTGLERGYHATLALSRVHGEWFERSPFVRAEIAYWRAVKRRHPCVSR